MAKISSWHFRHLLYVVWLKMLAKGGSQAPKNPPLATPMLLQLHTKCGASFAMHFSAVYIMLLLSYKPSLFTLKICLHQPSVKSFLSGAPPPKRNAPVHFCWSRIGCAQ